MTTKSISLPWPQPEPRTLTGHWEPAIIERYPDGTALALWRWVEDEWEEGLA
jgi:hypothetical protein